MRGARSLLIVVPMALALSGCFRSAQQYMVYDPNTGQSYTTTTPPQQAYGYPAQQQGFELYGQANASAQQSYAQQPPAASQPQTPQQVTQDDMPQRGLFNRHSSSSYTAPAPTATPAPQQSYIVQYGAGAYAQQPNTYAQPTYAPQTYAAPAPTYAAPTQSYAAAPRYAAPAYAAPQNYGYTSASPYQPSYTLDAGDKLRIVVFGQEGLTNSYVVDASGSINMPLVGTLPARGVSTQ